MTDRLEPEMVSEAVSYIRDRTDHSPDIALILGSGLGDLADAVTGAVSFASKDIPHFPNTTVRGHKGRLVLGSLGGRSVVVIQGRLHMYEGHSIPKVVFPLHLVHALGASCLFVTNASGGIQPGFRPGTLMWITDHINWTGECLSNKIAPDTVAAASMSTGLVEHPLMGRIRESVDYYDDAWTRRAALQADALGIPTRRGTYLWTRGPTYETKAEIKAFRTLGADAVGMSTVPEVIAAHRLGMTVIGLSTITNLAAGLGNEMLDHSEVIETGKSVRGALEQLAIAVLKTAPE